MVDCGPSCAVPSCASTPIIGFGSAGLGYGGLGYGGLSWGYRGRGYGAVETSSSLGTLAGVRPSSISQLLPAEVMIQPPPFVLAIPGPILSASCEPLSVGGNTPCAVVQTHYGGLGRRTRGFLGRRASISGYPC